LRYALQARDVTLKAGEARLADMNYLFVTPPVRLRDGDLPYEKRMIEHWFGQNFAAD